MGTQTSVSRLRPPFRAFGEWFDSCEEIKDRIPIHQSKQRKAYPWMVNWSYNNRLKRMMTEDELDGSTRRLFLHYNHKNLYESYQWGLRNLREARKKQFEEIRKSHGTAYYGEADIQEFYPTLRLADIISAMTQRLAELRDLGIIDPGGQEAWNVLLRSMLDFREIIDFTDALSYSKDQVFAE